MDHEIQATLRFPGRYYQMGPAISPGGEIQRLLELPVAETCFVEFHCWNSDYPEGPVLPMDRWYIYGGISPTSEEGSGSLVQEIIDHNIAPAMAASRLVGLPVFHVQPPLIGLKYPQSHQMLEPDDLEEQELPEAFPGWRQRRANKVYGFGYREWEGWGDLDIAPPVSYQDGDYIVVSGAQFDRLLRHLGVVNLIYTGFHAYSSLLHSPGGIREMAHRYGYRPILLREGTLAEECPDTLSDRLMTRAAFRFIEVQYGYTARLADFLYACKAMV